MWTIRRGMVGPKVQDLQIALNAFTGAQLKVDGIFGPKTEHAVRTFQLIFDLATDGIVGRQTGARLVAAALCANPYQMRAMASRKSPS